MRAIERLTPKKHIPLISATGILVLGLFAMSVAGGKPSGGGSPNREAVAPLVETVRATVSDRRSVIEAPGRLQARQRLAVVAEVPGKVTYVNEKFVVGGRLEAGDVLFRINPADYDADRATAQAALDRAEATLVQARRAQARTLNLSTRGAASEAAQDTAVANLASAEAGVVQAKAQLNRAEENIDRTIVKAPFPALVVSETVSVDTYVAPGQTLGTLIDTRAGELAAGLSPEQAAMVARMAGGEDSKIAVTARPNSGSVGSVVLSGYIDQFSPEIDASSRSAVIVAVFPDAFSAEQAGQVFANDFMTLTLALDSSEPTWTLPAGTVRKGRFVWTVQGGALARLPVRVVGGDGGFTTVSANQDLGQYEILLSQLSEEAEGFQVRTRPQAPTDRQSQD